MKMTPLPNNHWALTVPEGMIKFWIAFRGELNLVCRNAEEHTKVIELPPGKWVKVGLGSELSEEQWKGVVEEKYGGFAGHIHGYKNYDRKFMSMDEAPLKTATESGLSLLSHNKLNPATTLFLKQQL